MRRITGPDAEANLFGSGKDGFREGDPGIQEGTTVSAQFLNDVQEEPCAVIEQGGDAILGNTPNQLLAAIRKMIAQGVQALAIGSLETRTPDASFAGSFNDVCWNGTFFVAVGASGCIQTSADGLTWATQTPDASFAGVFYAVCWSGSLFVAVGAAGEVQTSPDGATWTHRVSGFGSILTAVCWNGSKFVAVGASGEIRTSPTGTTWTHQAADASYAGSFQVICWNGALFVAVGAAKEIQTSPDGVAWTRQTSPAGFTSETISEVVWIGRRFVIFTTIGKVATSPDGLAWTDQMPAHASSFRAAVWTGSLLCVVADSYRIQLSTDGITWRNMRHRATPANQMLGVCLGSDCLMIVGSAGAILQTLRF